MSTNRTASTAVHAAFFLSGVASLACEVVWFKLFGLVVGNSTFTVSIVIATFFVGLGLGSIVVGRLADRWARPLQAYGWLELILAVTSAATTLMLVNWQAWIGWFRPFMAIESAAAMPLKTALAVALLLPPTMLMGSTLPVLARFLVRTRMELAGRVGWLYAINTLGAAVGCATVGFVLIGLLGMQQTALLASGVYAAIGVVALALSRSEAATEPPAEPATPLTDTQIRSARMLIGVFAISGFTAVSYEVLWFRLLSIFSVNTAYAFASLLTVYLLGLVVGAVISAKWLAPWPERHLVWFARIQLAIAVTGLVTLAGLGRFTNLLNLLAMDTLAFSGMLKLGLAVGLVLIIPTTLIGLTFPLASEITMERLSGLGSRLGLVYGMNTIVGAAGSMVTGFLFIPLLGTQATAFVLALLNIALFAAIVLMHPRLRSEAGVVREGLATLVLVPIVWLALGPDYLHRSMTNILDAEVLSFRETSDGTFLLVEYTDDDARYQQVIVNGTSYANNRPPGRRYMALLAHLPILLHPDPENVVVICVGTGTTVGAASLHRGVEQVWAVDLAQEIFRIAPYFSPWNHNFFEAPHVRQVVADGRHFLTVSDEQFDVLTFEPPPPLEAGVAHLYSREFYDLAVANTTSDGIVAQWIPFHQGFEQLQRQLIRTMMEVYPHVSLWVTDRHEGLVIGSSTPLNIDLEQLRQRMEAPGVAEDLRQVGILSAEDLLATFVASDEALADYVSDGSIVTDDLPTVERFLWYENRRFTMEDLLQHREPVQAIVAQPLDAQAMARSQAWTDALWAANDHEAQREPAAASEILQRALVHQPDNPFLAYRQREMARAAEAVAD